MIDLDDRLLLDRFASQDDLKTSPDFDDVRRRARRLADRRATKLKVRVAAAVALAVGVAFAGFMLFGPTNSSGSSGLDRLSNRGTRAPAVRAVGYDLHEAHRLGRRNGHDFYRLLTSSSGTCYGIGSANVVGFIACPHGTFPKASYPIMVSTVAGSTARGASRSALRATLVEGFSADGVASVDILDSDSKRVGDGPITDNVFSFPVSASAVGMTIIGRDVSGDVVWSQRQ
jgi:hypothetical protein